jgi:hypothetical protein
MKINTMHVAWLGPKKPNPLCYKMCTMFHTKNNVQIIAIVPIGSFSERKKIIITNSFIHEYKNNKTSYQYEFEKEDCLARNSNLLIFNVYPITKLKLSSPQYYLCKSQL